MLLAETVNDTANIVSLYAGPVIGVLGTVVAILTTIFSRQNARATVSVNEKEANTHEFDAMRQGFKDSIDELNRRLDDRDEEAARTAQKTAEREAELNEKMDKVTERVGILEEERIEMLHHIIAVEEMVPNPPGPPIRPKWQ